LALFRLLEGGLSVWIGLAGRSARITSRPSPSSAGWELETWNLKPGTDPHA
jgi:hypothetical protein